MGSCGWSDCLSSSHAVSFPFSLLGWGAAAPSPAGSAEVVITRFSHRAALVLCDGDAEVSLPHPVLSCLYSSPSPPGVRPQPAL
jgi:hypothetical protein